MSESTRFDKFDFKEEFESLLVACILKMPDKFIHLVGVIQSTYFTSISNGTAVKVVQTHYNKWSRIPTIQMFLQLFSDAAKDVRSIEDSDEYLRRINELSVDDWEAVYDRVRLFCRERATVAAIKQSVAKMREGEYPEGGFASLFEQAVQVGQNLDDIGYILHNDYSTIIDKETDISAGISTGWSQFDNIWRRGLKPGWLVVPLAPPKRYKSTFCLNMALNMVSPSVGQDVIYYSAEISAEQAMHRIMYNMTGVGETGMFEGIDVFKDKVKAQIEQRIAANLLVKHYPIGTATIGDMKAHCKLAMKQTGIKPKAIFIDYADSIRASNANEQTYVQQMNVYKEAIAFGKEVGAAIIMPDRCTKDAVDTRVPSMKAFQGSFAKGGIVDAAIGICSTNEEYSKNILRFFVFVNRHGPAFQHFQGKIDPERSRIDIGKEIAYDPDDEIAEDKKSRGNGGGGRGRSSSQAIPEDLV
jgi:replicative DNA helicase